MVTLRKGGRRVARYVGEGGGGEAGFAVLEFDGYGRLAFYGVDHLGFAEGEVDVVVAVPVHQSFGVSGDFYVEDADGFVFEGQVMVGLGGDFDFGRCGLSGQRVAIRQKKIAAFHAGILALAAAGTSGAKAFTLRSA